MVKKVQEIKESIDTEELKENVVQSSKWIRILLVIVFCVVYYYVCLFIPGMDGRWPRQRHLGPG